jgi:hypothetical protein
MPARICTTVTGKEKKLTAAIYNPPMLVYNRSHKKMGKETREGNQREKKAKSYNKGMGEEISVN